MIDNSRNVKGPSLLSCILKSDNLSAGFVAGVAGVATMLIKDVLPFVGDPAYSSGMPNPGPRFLVDGAVALGVFALAKIGQGIDDFVHYYRDGQMY
jgi:hypothetical protein